MFTSWGVETAKRFTKEQLEQALEALDSGDYGVVLRAKGIVAGEDGSWLHFDYVPGEVSIRSGSAGVIGRICVIGSQLQQQEIAEVLGV